MLHFHDQPGGTAIQEVIHEKSLNICSIRSGNNDFFRFRATKVSASPGRFTIFFRPRGSNGRSHGVIYVSAWRSTPAPQGASTMGGGRLVHGNHLCNGGLTAFTLNQHALVTGALLLVSEAADISHSAVVVIIIVLDHDNALPLPMITCFTWAHKHMARPRH